MDITSKQLVSVQDTLRNMGAAISGMVTADAEQGNRASEVAETLLETGTAQDYFNLRADGTRISKKQSGFTEARASNQEAVCTEIARGLPAGDKDSYDKLVDEGKKGFGTDTAGYERARKIQSRVLMAFGRITKAMLGDVKPKVSAAQCFAAIASQVKKLSGLKLNPAMAEAKDAIAASLAKLPEAKAPTKGKAQKLPKATTASVKARKPTRTSKPLI